jgi:formamidopyrimidine-DNA glycosylase
LFQARIHPEVPAKALGPQRSAALLAALTRVCATAVAADADSTQFPADWLFGRRWGKKAGTTACGSPLAFITVGGRTSCFAPALQRKTEGAGAEAGAAAAPKAAPKKRSKAAAPAAAEEEAEEAAVPAAPAAKRGKAAAAVPRGAGRRGAASAAAQLAAAAAGRLRLP